jgi:hypothetical protein
VRLILTSRHEQCEGVSIVDDVHDESKINRNLPSFRSSTVGVLIGHLKHTLTVMVAFSAVWILVFLDAFYRTKNYYIDMKAYHKWRDCVAANYDGVNDSSWRSVCGPYASLTTQFMSTKISIAFEASNGIVCGIICLYVARETLWSKFSYSYKALRRLRTYVISSVGLSRKSLAKNKIAVDAEEHDVDDGKRVQFDDSPDNPENINDKKGRGKIKRAPKSSNIDQSLTNNFRKPSSFWSRNGFSVAPLSKAAWNIGFVSLASQDAKSERRNDPSDCSFMNQVLNIPSRISSESQKSQEQKSIELVDV